MRLWFALWICTVAGSAFAGSFEGILDLKVSTSEAKGQGTIRLYLGKAGSRTEMNSSMGKKSAAALKMTVVQPKGSKSVFMVDDAHKTYSEMDVPKSSPSQTPYTAKKLGTEKVAGYDTVHVLLTAPAEEVEVWSTEALGSFEDFSAGGHSPVAEGGAIYRALQAEGVKGFPVRIIQRRTTEPKSTTTLELTKAEPQTLPASMFEVPKGYAKNAVMDQMMNTLPPEVRQAFEKMTPEQRKQIEEQMRAAQKAQQTQSSEP